ncbi:MAG TPA: hypothetical protein VK388_12225 [Pyrinomonadaceae bacterium]|nr:hypothetical protein [Pyrinomonadaceae bacterium]
MRLRSRVIVVSLTVSSLLLWSATLVCAQQPGAAKSPAGRAGARAGRGKTGAADPLAEARRATAISLISSLADEARGFRDETLRARVQARAADALWETDAERGRTLFRRAWDAAEVSDRESIRRSEEERRANTRSDGGSMWSSPRNLRGEVLRLAARRDRALGEEFLARLDEARKQERESAAAKTAEAALASNPNNSEAAAAAVGQRLELATQLLRDGDTERAIQFAAPALRRVDQNVLGFLATLRVRNAGAADKVYAALLASAATDPATNPNTVSLLSSYIFTPGMFIEFDRGGGYSVNQNDDIPAPDNVPADLRAGFFALAAQVLLRPLVPVDQDRSSSGRAGTYFVIARLLPLFEQYAPDTVPALRAQLSALTPDVPAEYRSGDHPLLTKGLSPASETYDGVQRALDKLDTARNAEERDGIYVEATFAANAKNDPRTREFADKIEHAETRRSLRAFLDYSDITRAIQKKDAAEVVRLAKNGEITSIQRVWAYTEAARLLSKTDRTRALEALDEAANETRRIDGAHADRARAMLAVASLLYELDRARVWTLMPDAVRTINAVSDFSGEDGQLVARFQTRKMGSFSTSDAPSFNLQPLFALLAAEDMDRSVELARSFTGESPRAVATLAIAVAALKDKPKPKP